MERLLVFYVLGTIIFFVLAFVFTLVSKTLPVDLRVPFCTLIYTLLFTPSAFVGGSGAGGGVFIGIPIPFGGHIAFLLSGDTRISDIVNTVKDTWHWHIPAFVVVGFISYKVARKFVGT